jgi:Ca-activated chloride channel homolog
MQALIHNFHFLRPAWLLVLPLLWVVIAWAWRQHGSNSAWKNVIDSALLPSLQLEKGLDGHKLALWSLIGLLWTMASLALAGPSWQKVAGNAYRAPASWIMVLDLSSSMASKDIEPNRATRARYAMNDILDGAGENKVGLVIFSDEAYTVVPLTDDVANVRAMLESLTPDIMPSQGDNLTPALARARDLLEASGGKNKQIILLTDGFKDGASAINMAKTLATQGISLDVLGIQSPVSTDVALLKDTAKAGAGQYYTLSQLPNLLNMLKKQNLPDDSAKLEKNVKLEKWLDNGVLLLPLLVLLAALLGRKGWL